MSERPLQSIIDEAAHWMMRLQSGEIQAEELRAFERWQAGDPRHAQVFQRMAGRLDVVRQPALAQLSERQVIQALNSPSSRRRFIQGSLAVVGAVGVSALGVRLAASGFAWPGELYTGVGERRTLRLEDGSRLTLDARSRVTPQPRGLRLQQGSLLLEASAGDTPFLLQSRAGRAEAQPGRLLLSARENGPVRLTALDGRVRLAGGQWLLPGQTARFAADGSFVVAAASGSESAWLDGRLEVDDRPLGEVIDSLRAYRHGVLRVSPEAAALRTSGLYPLDDSERALQLLARTLPIRIRRYSGLWISIERA
ncbi:FecR family protein [Stutzerimonas kirkiae]|uniref:Iron dicitrate transport regulator FecR n=1 Tax=Stutzerimonas kirkiae TaxID=2211392 RepID=A0A4Q9R7F6_9GAMM|nr:DUF4880 domain-containing protein [Stutzerimonas kirkiae]TBU96537.1 iron dicitrate transport regulator FecR [Stutzerimonas kirkiae]TBV02179.1 iron dicitrate transport regulator FecR [Stutzerimonas kirkiae]TBV08848.1 iron dicitrate transport regulator FecR [Stutzerimonas kirkiae]